MTDGFLQVTFFATAVILPFIVESIFAVVPVHCPVIYPLLPVGNCFPDVFRNIILWITKSVNVNVTACPFWVLSTDKAASSKKWISPCSTAFFSSTSRGMRMKRMLMFACAACCLATSFNSNAKSHPKTSIPFLAGHPCRFGSPLKFGGDCPTSEGLTVNQRHHIDHPSKF